MDENEFLLEDRIAKIQAIDKEYNLRENAYISFSGGKDSTILHHLIDIALPNNKIPRLFFNTGIEYLDLVKYVKDIAKTDERIVIYNSGVNIKKMQKEYGYPFKSKQHSHNVNIYQHNKNATQREIDRIENQLELKQNYEYIHNLPNGIKTTIKYLYGIRERESSCLYLFADCP